MNFKTTIILALVFAVGVVGVVLLNKQKSNKEEQEKVAGKLLNLEKDQVKEIMLEPSGIHIVKDSTEWKITEPIKTDGDKSSIDAIANMFNWAKVERVVSSDPSELKTFGLAPEKGKLILTHDSGTDTLFLGDDNPTGSYVFARKSGSNEIFLTTTSLKTNIEKKLFDLRNKKVLDFEKNQVRSFEFKNKKQTFTVEKSGEKWALTQPIQDQADKSAVDELLNRLNSERAKEFVDEAPKDLDKYGLRRPEYKVDLLLGVNKAKKSLLIGVQKGKQFYAQDESRPPVFLVDSALVKELNVSLFDMRNKDLTDFSSTDVNKFELTFADTTLMCQKDTSGTWMILEPMNVKAKSWKISSITSAANRLKVKEFVNDAPSSLKKYGLDKPAVIGRFFKDGDLLAEILVGKKSGKDNVYVKLGDRNNVYAVGADILQKLRPNVKDLSDSPVAENK
jgi:hypothetical protein